MIIELDKSLKNIQSDLTDEHPLAIALDIIANANREGCHVVFSDRDVADHLLSIGAALSGRTKQALKHIYNRATQLAEFAEIAYVKLLVGDFSEISHEKIGNQRLIKVPANSINSALLQKPYLLVENLDDAIFYRFITEQLNDELNSLGTVAFEPYNGGGNTTGDVYDHIKGTAERLCLCIVDSDRRFPGASPGETASKVEASDRIRPSALAESYVLPVCSIENLIPFDFLRKVFQGDKTITERLDVYEAHHRDEIWPFVQLKKDIRCADLCDERRAFSIFWTERLGCTELISKCVSTQQCEKRDKCATTILPPVSHSPLDAVLSGLDSMTLKATTPLPSVKAAWVLIARLISAWCCGGPHLAVG